MSGRRRPLCLRLGSYIVYVPAFGLLALMPASVDPIRFEEIAERAGVRFVLENAVTPERHLIETMVGGAAVFDYNNDRRLDIYFVNGAAQPGLQKSRPAFFNRLYRNEGAGSFRDVTMEAGVKGEGYGIGVAAADYDNDGNTDLFVGGVNRNILYRNKGDGTFEDVTVKAGLAGPQRWSVGGGWFDFDSDGWLDLFVVNYCAWDPAKEQPCLARGERIYCHPRHYAGRPNVLYRNNGDGSFTDVSVASGIAAHVGKGMAAAFFDYDRDGKLDVFVTNDAAPNFLFRNEGGGRFREVALVAGVAFNDDGRLLSSMGADARDVDNDGIEDVFVTANGNETFPLFRNSGRGHLSDVTYPSGLGRLTMPFTGWSNGIFDFNNDGRKDLFAACGALDDNTERFSSRASKQRNLVLANPGNGEFTDPGAGLPAAAGRHRGAAFGDLDGDGRVDVVVTRIGEPASMLRNVSPAANHWLAVRLRGTRSNRDGIGAWIQVTGTSGNSQWNRATTAVGYGSSSDRVVYFGLGRDRVARQIEIAWPSGIRQVLRNVEADRYLDVVEPSIP